MPGLTHRDVWALSDWFLCCSGNSVDELLDAENRRMADNLASKVSRLKSVSSCLPPDSPESMWERVLLPYQLTPCWPVPVMLQLAFEIDREADDQNDYLDSMVRSLRSSGRLLLSADGSASSCRTPTSWVQRVCWAAAWSGSPPWCAPGGTTAVFCVTCPWGWSWSSSCFTTWSPGLSSDPQPLHKERLLFFKQRRSGNAGWEDELLPLAGDDEPTGCLSQLHLCRFIVSHKHFWVLCRWQAGGWCRCSSCRSLTWLQSFLCLEVYWSCIHDGKYGFLVFFYFSIFPFQLMEIYLQVAFFKIIAVIKG